MQTVTVNERKSGEANLKGIFFDNSKLKELTYTVLQMFQDYRKIIVRNKLCIRGVSDFGRSVNPISTRKGK